MTDPKSSLTDLRSRHTQRGETGRRRPARPYMTWYEVVYSHR